MAVAPYWRERLAARRPIRNDAYWVEGFDYKLHDDRPGDTWPKRLAKQALWMDYLAWFEDVYLPPFKEAPYYQDFPDQLPKPCTEVEFWAAIAPFLYVVGRNIQTRGYFVWGQRQHLGQWVKCKVHRNFIRMADHEECLSTFAMQMGEGGADDVRKIARATERAHRSIATNTAKLPASMRKAD